jgi:type IV pilus assembly protein PilA
MRHRCPISSDLVREQPGARIFLRLASAVVLVSLSIFFLGTPASAFQTQPRAATPGQRKSAPNRPSSRTESPAPQAPEADLGWLRDALSNPELMSEVERLMEKLRSGVQYPAARNRSAILPRLPEGTMLYAALPNFGEQAHQALQIFRQELKESPQLQDFLRKNKLDATEPKIEEGVEKFYEFSQFLGDEFVIAGKLKGQDPSGVLAAEIKKPGLREFLDKLNATFTSQGDRLRILDPQQLASAGETDVAHGPAVLIRPDFMAVSFNVTSLREFSSQVDNHGPRFASSALGQRLAQAYQEGANSIIGLDLHKLIGLIPLTKPQDKVILEKTGFGDVNYLVASYAMSAARLSNESELTFTGPRHGIASWIAAPKPMGGFDFVSTHAALAVDLILKNPPQIFDDLRDLMGETAFASLPQMEAQLNVNLKRDLLSKLGGEIAFETQPMTLPGAPQATSFNQGNVAAKPGPFKVILSVSDPAGLQQTLTKLLATAPVQTGQRQEDGVTFNTVTLPSQSDPPVEINYFSLDGYLVIASDRATAREAARAHRSGESLAKSGKLRDALWRQSLNASIIMYQDAGRMLAPMLSQLPPEMNRLLAAGGGTQFKPSVVSVLADESSFRAFANTDGQVNVTLPVILAAVAIPSVLRARVQANASTAESSLRAVNTAQVTYSATYPAQGYASNLAALGQGSGRECPVNPTPAQACLLDNSLAGTGCTTGQWCEKDGYKFTIRAVCMQGRCFNYAVTATPANSSAGTKSYCSTSDAVIRSHQGTPLSAPLTATECKTWPPLR